MKKLGTCPLYADWRARSASRNSCSISQILLSTALIGENISITSVIAGIRKTWVVSVTLYPATMSPCEDERRVRRLLFEIQYRLGEAVDEGAFFLVNLEIDATDLARHHAEELCHISRNLKVGRILNRHGLCR